MTTTGINVRVDPVLTAVLDSRLMSIVDQVAGAMVRTSMSPIFAEARDVSAALFDRNLRLIAQRDWLPVLASNLSVAIQEIAGYWEDELCEGDVLVHNDPYGKNSHTPDINVAKPVFHDGRIVFWAVAKGHHVDVGGRGLAGYDPTARTTWDDGIVLKPAKLYDAGKYNRTVWDFLKTNTKIPALVEADLNSQVGACVVGERALLALVDQYGTDSIYRCLDEIMDATERGLRQKISKIADGVYLGEKAFDDDAVNRGKPVTVRAQVKVSGSDVSIDLSSSDPQVPSYLNSTWGNTYSVANMAVLYFVEGDTKRNDGALRPIDLVTAKGTCVDPEFPAATTMCTCTLTETIFEAVTLALAPAKPEWATGAHGKMSQLIATGINPRTGRFFANLDFATVAEGSGGTAGYDGWPQGGPTHTMGQLRQPDPEIMELVTPTVVWVHELVGGREGIGQYRGGFGTRYKVEYLTDASACEVGQGHAEWAVPAGLFGGGSPPPSRPIIRHTDGTVSEVVINAFMDLKCGDIYEQDQQGGAGWGDPLQRDPALVQKDVHDEFLTPEEARVRYGVVIKDGQVDYEATAALRS